MDDRMWNQPRTESQRRRAQPRATMNKPKLATCWLDGCSGCHMSMLDMDERLIALAKQVDVVYGPYVDVKEFPENVDLTLVEGAISSEEDLHKIQLIRSRTRILAVLGDCGITGNVPSMRNSFSVDSILDRVYANGDGKTAAPTEDVPRLLTRPADP